MEKPNIAKQPKWVTIWFNSSRSRIGHSKCSRYDVDGFKSVRTVIVPYLIESKGIKC